EQSTRTTAASTKLQRNPKHERRCNQSEQRQIGQVAVNADASLERPSERIACHRPDRVIEPGMWPGDCLDIGPYQDYEEQRCGQGDIPDSNGVPSSSDQ